MIQSKTIFLFEVLILNFLINYYPIINSIRSPSIYDQKRIFIKQYDKSGVANEVKNNNSFDTLLLKSYFKSIRSRLLILLFNRPVKRH